MTTKHQAPEVTSELRECPFCGENMNVMATWIANAEDSGEAMQAPVCPCGAQGPMYPTREAAITAWNTRATQPQSLTIDEVREPLVEAWKVCQRVKDESQHAAFEGLHYRRGFSAGTSGCIAAVLAVINRTDADRLQSLSQPVGDEDRKLFDALRDESWDLRCFDIPTGGGDADIGWCVVGHYQADPSERVIAEVFHDNPRDALRAALAAPKHGEVG